MDSHMFLAVLIGCGELPKTKSGVEIDFIRVGDGKSPDHSDIISLNMMYLSEAGDTLFNTVDVGAPVQIMFDTTQWKDGGMLYEVLELLEVGDSVSFQIPARNLFEISFQGTVPEEIP